MSEMENLMDKLRQIKSKTKQSISNTKKIWQEIGEGKDFKTLGFSTIEEYQEWLNNNPYSNI